MDSQLHRFYNDDHTREAVREYLLDTLDKLALEKIYKREPVDGLADAQEAIENMFTQLGDEYGTKQKKNISNEAR